ncbi:Pentapeptide repeat-containing protein [Granulicella pectinivorans]|uniref:Pentapeptide repeat-containing protein n=1 Tax=Granulicella pectinivorans TaxID=474950 RepID=A0A1I6LMC6_9BACT|nr:pentapeptide repeat-containing protein [Granulicella pectinivorans]SFS04573.1 Pentapeptide repeat-containing protein [Granulicella pectinivorans]
MLIRHLDGSFLLDTNAPSEEFFQDLRGADFRGWDSQAPYPDATDMLLDLGMVDLRGADFTGADMYWVMFFEADCEGAIFRNARFYGCDLKNVNFRGADLRGAILALDNLNGATHLMGADLSGALLEGCNMTGTEYDKFTVFPEGFDPEAHGMILLPSEAEVRRPYYWERSKDQE